MLHKSVKVKQVVLFCIVGLIILMMLKIYFDNRLSREINDVETITMPVYNYRKHHRKFEHDPNSKYPICGDSIDLSRLEILSVDPRVAVYHDFLDEWEIEYMRKLGEPYLKRSEVLDAQGNQKEENERTSYGFFFNQTDDFVLRNIENRIANLVQVPPENGELFYLLRYEKGQEYKQHFDAFNPNLDGVDLEKAWGPSGTRICTVIMYIAAPEDGGETAFPKLGFKVTGGPGDALLFWTFKPNHQWDDNTLHAGYPVKNGTKYIITKWIREKSFYPRVPLQYSRMYLPLSKIESYNKTIIHLEKTN